MFILKSVECGAALHSSVLVYSDTGYSFPPGCVSQCIGWHLAPQHPRGDDMSHNGEHEQWLSCCVLTDPRWLTSGLTDEAQADEEQRAPDPSQGPEASDLHHYHPLSSIPPVSLSWPLIGQWAAVQPLIGGWVVTITHSLSLPLQTCHWQLEDALLVVTGILNHKLTQCVTPRLDSTMSQFYPEINPFSVFLVWC